MAYRILSIPSDYVEQTPTLLPTPDELPAAPIGADDGLTPEQVDAITDALDAQA